MAADPQGSPDTFQRIVDGIDRALGNAPDLKRVDHASFWKWCDDSVVPAVSRVCSNDNLRSTLFAGAWKSGTFLLENLRRHYEDDAHRVVLMGLLLASFDEAPKDESRQLRESALRARDTRHKDRQSYRNMVSNVRFALQWSQDELASRIRDIGTGMAVERGSGMSQAFSNGKIQAAFVAVAVRQVMGEGLPVRAGAGAGNGETGAETVRPRKLLGPLVLWLVVFSVLELTLAFCAWRWGQGDNLWQKILASLQFFAAALVVCVGGFLWHSGEAGRRLLKRCGGKD